MIYCVANSKGGTGKTAFTVNLIQHLEIDFIIDVDVTHRGITSVLSLSKNRFDIRSPEDEKDILKWVEEGEYKNIIIDCGGFYSTLTQYAISQSDVVITPSNDDPTEQFGLANFNKAMISASNLVGENLKSIVVINKVYHSRRYFSVMESFIKTQSNLVLSNIIIPYSASIPNCQFSGDAVKSGSIAAKFYKLAKTLKGINMASLCPYFDAKMMFS